METLKRNWLKAIMGLTLALGAGYFAVDASESKIEAITVKPMKLANPQWFAYTANPNSANFATEKLNPANYSATTISNINSRPCPLENEFCGIYAETIMSGTVQQPNLSVGQPVRTELDSYNNGDGESHLTYIDEKE